MCPNEAFRVIGSKLVFEDLNLFTEIQFSSDVAHLSIHLIYLYWLMSSNEKSEAHLGSWHLSSDNDSYERSNTSEFEIKGNPTILSVWLTSFECYVRACPYCFGPRLSIFKLQR